jgi:hypothetical protein
MSKIMFSEEEKRTSIVDIDIQITWNNGYKEFRSDVPYIKSLEEWCDAIEEEEGEKEE